MCKARDTFYTYLLSLVYIQVRYKQDVRNIGKTSRNPVSESDLPVKLFVVGPTKAGKTSTVKSIFHCLDQQEMSESSGFSSSTVTADSLWKTKHIAEDSWERTICLTIHRIKLAADIFSIIYDLGGNETYYALQAIFLDLRNGFFLIVVDIREPKEYLQCEIEKQLSLISSKLPKNVSAEVLLVFTHVDQVEENVKAKKMCTCKQIRLVLKEFQKNIRLVKEVVFINAKDAESEEIQKLLDICKKMAKNVKDCLV